MKPEKIVWKVGEKLPPWLDVTNLILPRPLAWLSVSNQNKKQVCLLNGYTAAAYTPPVLYFAASALPSIILECLKDEGKCTLSAVTLHEASVDTVQWASSSPQAFAFGDLGLRPTTREGSRNESYPDAVAGSPIHMYCSLDKVVPLGDDNGDAMILLWVETFVIDGSVISDPDPSMKQEQRNMSGKIDAELIRPLVGTGHGRVASLSKLLSMPRPKQQQDTGKWTSTTFDVPVATAQREQNHQTIEWRFREHGRSCSLGFNPMTALIMPRPIGWISTYSKNGRVPHLAPYSFFMDVNRKSSPMVAFSGYRRDGKDPKDAQKDAEETGCFCYNMVSQDLAIPMNLSAAEVGRVESEFAIAGLAWESATVVDAPMVPDARIKMECEYVQTVDVDSFSIVIGAVKVITVHPDVVLANGTIDVDRLMPVARLGYLDEYGVL